MNNHLDYCQIHKRGTLVETVGEFNGLIHAKWKQTMVCLTSVLSRNTSTLLFVKILILKFGKTIINLSPKRVSHVGSILSTVGLLM